MGDIDLNSKEATIVKEMLMAIDPNVAVNAVRLNNDFYTAKLESGNKSGIVKIRCNLLSDLKPPKHYSHLDAELEQTLRYAVNCMQ
jgi:hypothetical protein